uniref:Uncharacterized protein n=1 Tax=Bionectria ochroleuca TaxID=29856 RepID=A0A8H7K578_BIOOC
MPKFGTYYDGEDHMFRAGRDYKIKSWVVYRPRTLPERQTPALTPQRTRRS